MHLFRRFQLYVIGYFGYSNVINKSLRTITCYKKHFFARIVRFDNCKWKFFQFWADADFHQWNILCIFMMLKLLFF